MPDQEELAEIPVHFKVEWKHAFGGTLTEVRRYFWTGPLEETVYSEQDKLVINMALTSRPASTRVDSVASANDPLSPEAGRILIMLPGAAYRLAAPIGSLRSLHCSIPCTKVDALVDEPIDWPTLTPFTGEACSNLGIEVHMLRIYDEMVHERLGAAKAIEASVELLCVELARRFRHGTPKQPMLHVGGLAAWRMRTIIDCQSARKRDPLSASKRDPLAEQRGRYDRRSIRAARGVVRA